MSKFEGMHNAGGHVSSSHNIETNNLLASVQDFCTRTTHASDVVFGGLIDGASNDMKKQIQHPDQLMNDACVALASGATGKVVGIGMRFCPVVAAPMAVIGTGVALYNLANSESFKTTIPELQRTWQSAFAENDMHKLQVSKDKVSAKYGHQALEIGIGVGSAAIGFGSGLKTGRLLQTRLDGLSKSPQVLKEVSGRNPIKALYVDKVLKQKPVGSKVDVDEYGVKRLYHPDHSFEAHYPDGSKFHRSPGGITTRKNSNGEVVRELPGVMRIQDKHNGDRVYKYHGDGMVETHKPTGTIIREHYNGIVDTHRTNGVMYREHPNGTTEVFKKSAS